MCLLAGHGFSLSFNVLINKKVLKKACYFYLRYFMMSVSFKIIEITPGSGGLSIQTGNQVR